MKWRENCCCGMPGHQGICDGRKVSMPWRNCLRQRLLLRWTKNEFEIPQPSLHMFKNSWKEEPGVESVWNRCILWPHNALTIHDSHDNWNGHERQDLAAMNSRARMPGLSFFLSCRDHRDICLCIQRCLQTQQLFPSRRSISNPFVYGRLKYIDMATHRHTNDRYSKQNWTEIRRWMTVTFCSKTC